MTTPKVEILPVTRSKTEARHSYDRLSRWYDLIAGGSEDKFRRMGLNLLNVRAGETILEIGCGTGSSLVALADAVGPDGKILGMDISNGMLAQAVRKIKQTSATNIYTVAADGLHLPLTPNSLDAIFMTFTLELFASAEIPQVLAACKALLKDCGRIGLVSMAQSGKKSLMTRLYDWAHIHWENYVDCRPIPTVKLLQESGFIIETSQQSSMWGLAVNIVLATINQ
jgi:demethylmenaquinone methyltransferase/2-methoxy-6-polyprenyl-1,4-benzoquinol methylase